MSMFNCTEGNVGGCFCAAVMLGSQEFQHMWIMTEDKKKKHKKHSTDTVTAAGQLSVDAGI